MKKALLLSFTLLCHSLFSLEPIILLFGPPGSGKGTFGEFAVQRGYNHISAGDLVRDEINRASEIGNKIRDIVARGDYIDPELMFQILSQRVLALLSENKPLIIDGYGRDSNALEQLVLFLKQEELASKTFVILFDVDDAVCKERIQGRLICSSCHHIANSADHCYAGQECPSCHSDILAIRINDTADVIEKRLQQYREKIEPVYRSSERFFPFIVLNPCLDREESYRFYDLFLEDIKQCDGEADDFVQEFKRKLG